MSALLGVIKWSRERFRYFLIKKLIIILMKESGFYTGKPLLATSLVQWDIEIDLIGSLSVNPQMTPHKQKYRPLK